jgi:selenocysteine-specific elongation factor
MRVIATAGHVDHGKSTLVHGLTGMDPDRFAEEKARGLTIDLGFAWTTLPSGEEIAFVDVPGHVRFLKNMLAGVGAVDACLFVVAATEGWKPQSEEHLRILELLGLAHGAIAMTKVGVVDEDTRELAHLEVAERVAGSFLERAEIVDVDMIEGIGGGELRAALDRLVAATPGSVDRGRPRLWVDRAFSAKGSGTVVTGTLAGGALRVDDELVLLPAGRTVRVRALQTHKSSLDVAGPGRRLAVNVTGVSHHDVVRGDALVRADQWERTRVVDASLSVLRSLDHDVSRRGAYQAYIGSGEYPVQLRVIGKAALEPGADGFARLHLPVELPLVPGDRFVLRESGRGETVGGGEVLDVAPVLPASKAAPSRSVARVVRERGWVDAGELTRLTGEAIEPTVGRWVVDPDELAATTERVRAQLDPARLDERERAVLATLDGGTARRGPDMDALRADPFLLELEAAAFRPPDPKDTGVGAPTLRALVEAGLVVERDGCWFAASAVSSAAAEIARLLATRPDGVTVAEVRDALGTTRKYLLPLLAHLDATGVTRRRGDLRIGGPRLPTTLG